MELDDDLIILFKLVTGELIIGVLDHELTEENENSDVLFVKNPAVIVVSQNSLYLAKYNQFSRLNTLMIMGKNVVYVDMPNDEIIAHYKELWKPKELKMKMDDEGVEQYIIPTPTLH